MFVSKVEARAPAPSVPSTGIPIGLRTVSSAEGSVQEAMFDARRAQIEMSQTTAANPANRRVYPNKHKQKTKASTGKQNSKNKGKGKATPTRKRKQKELFGTPGDIFKNKVKKGH